MKKLINKISARMRESKVLRFLSGCLYPFAYYWSGKRQGYSKMSPREKLKNNLDVFTFFAVSLAVVGGVICGLCWVLIWVIKSLWHLI
ncbi:hypothetical protein [Pseudomonas amygdali]|uniref:hypothetical protein n=1 Tax=Pseudomonas amygdali TaxID=47877 RepID=UPI000B2940A8|nr:hypothetical protein [Pseudomonas amygdali]